MKQKNIDTKKNRVSCKSRGKFGKNRVPQRI